MLDLLEGAEEYNNAGALLGLEGDNEELLGALRKMNPIRNGKTFQGAACTHKRGFT